MYQEYKYIFFEPLGVIGASLRGLIKNINYLILCTV